MPKTWPFTSRSKDPLQVKPGSTLRRDVYKAATAGFTGVTAFGALAVTGAVAGTAAHDKAVQDAAREAAARAQAAPSPQAAPVVTLRRAHRTVVHTKVLHEVSASGVTRPTTGGTVTRRPSSSTVTRTTVTHTAPRPVAKPAPKSAPKSSTPAPSSGS